MALVAVMGMQLAENDQIYYSSYKNRRLTSDKGYG